MMAEEMSHVQPPRRSGWLRDISRDSGPINDETPKYLGNIEK